MFNLEVPLRPVEPELIDPNYENRHNLIREAPSLPAIMLGHVANREMFSRQVPTEDLRCSWPTYLDLPLEVEREHSLSSVTYTLPDELGQFSEAIRLIAAHEHAAYPMAAYGRIRIDPSQGLVSPSYAQAQAQQFHRDRAHHGDWHHMYVVADRHPTEFYFSDESTPNLTIDASLASEEDMVTPEPYQITYFNGTTFHRRPAFDTPIVRTFLHVMYTHDLTAATG